MESYQEVARMDELADGSMKKVTIGGAEILLARSGDTVFAADNRCPHLAGDLSLGTFSGTVVTCPRHHSQFDLRDGKVIRWTDFSGLALKAAQLMKPQKPLGIYKTRVDGGRISVALNTG